MQSIKVADYMEHHPILVNSDLPLTSAVELLLRKKQAGAPVVDAENKLVGFLSEQDCLARMLSCSYHCDLTAKVSDVMKVDVLTAAPGDSIVSLAEQMLGSKPKIYPVVEEGEIVGMIDRSRVLIAMNKYLVDCFRHAV